VLNPRASFLVQIGSDDFSALPETWFETWLEFLFEFLLELCPKCIDRTSICWADACADEQVRSLRYKSRDWGDTCRPISRCPRSAAMGWALG